MFVYDRRGHSIYETSLSEHDIKNGRLFINGESRIVVDVYRTTKGVQVELDT